VFQWLNTVIGNVKNALRGTHHAVSENHLSLEKFLFFQPYRTLVNL